MTQPTTRNSSTAAENHSSGGGAASQAATSDVGGHPQRTRVLLPILDELHFGYRSDGGYEPEEVDNFLVGLKSSLAAAESERTALRADLAQLRDQISEKGEPAVAFDAVGLLSQAQLIADEAVAEAETYARDLMLTARSQYRDVLQRAERSTSAGVEHPQGAVGSQFSNNVTHSPQTPTTGSDDLAYVRTYAQVAQVQLRAVLEALADQVDRLSDFGSEQQPTQHTTKPETSAENIDLWMPTPTT